MHKTIVPGLIVVAMSICGCTTSASNEPLDEINPTVNLDAKIQTSEQISERIIGHTFIGRTNGFPKVGPIQFRVYYDPDGTITDLLRFENTGKTDRDIGIWRIAEKPQVMLCSRYKKRRGGSEKCSQVILSDDGFFQTVPNSDNNITSTGKVVAGNQVN